MDERVLLRGERNGRMIASLNKKLGEKHQKKVDTKKAHSKGTSKENSRNGIQH